MPDKKIYPILPVSILFVEDDAPSRLYASAVLKNAVETIYLAEDGSEGLELYQKYMPDIVITDISMPIMDGMEMSRKIKNINPKALIIFTTAFDHKSLLFDAIEIGISHYILKPLKKEKLLQVIENVSKVIILEKEVVAQFDSIRTLSSAVEQSAGIIVILDAKGKVYYTNPKFQESTGFDRTLIIGKSLQELVDYISAEHPGESLLNAFDTNTEHSCDLRLVKKNGDSCWYSVSISPILNQDGLPERFVLVANDINDRKLAQQELEKSRDLLEKKVQERTNELLLINKQLNKEINDRIKAGKELERAKENAEEANKAKGLFLAKVSHELRTPMNGIIGMTSIMISNTTDEAFKHSLDVVKYSADNLLAIINDILDYSRIESGKFMLSSEKFDIRSIISHTIALLDNIAEGKGLALTYSVQSDIPSVLIGDPHRIQQILMNIVGNGLKFTNVGKVALSVKIAKNDNMQMTLLFKVKDTGIGIPKSKYGMIFKSFSQVEHTMTRKYGGTGLGLAISKEIVESMGGEIGLNSIEGKGSEFYFTIVLDLPDAKPKNKSKAIDTRKESEGLLSNAKPAFKYKALVAEDSYINQQVIRGTFSDGLCELVIVENGVEAVKMFKKEKDFDIIFMDVQMPVMDGITASKQIRMLEMGMGKKTPIIGLTAHTAAVHRQECLKAGMDDVITKPFEADIILNKVNKYLRKESGHVTSKFPVNASINLNHLLKSIDSNIIVFKRISDYYRSNYRLNLTTLQNAVKLDDAIKVNSIAHKLKSEIGNFGMDRASELINALELMGKNSDLTDASFIVIELEELFSELDEYLKEVVNYMDLNN